jgi:hypothetical protein
MSLQTEVVNSLFETTTIDDRLFERKSWVEISASSFIQDQPSQPRQLIFSSLNCKDLYMLPHEGYIELEISLRRNDAGAFKDGDKFAFRNHVLSIFDNIEIQVSDQDNKIEELRFNEHWSNIVYLLKWSDNYAKCFGPEVLFYPDYPLHMTHDLTTDVTSNSFKIDQISCNAGLVKRGQLIEDSNKLVATLYLKDLPFFESYTGIWTKSRFRLILTPNYIKPIICVITRDGTKAEGMNYRISRANLYVPEVTLLPDTRLNVLKKFNDGFSKTHRWISLDCYCSPQFAAGTTNIQWTVSSEIKKPSLIYFLLVQDFSETDYQKKLTQIYNQFNITSYSLLINNKEAFNESNVDFSKFKCHRLYNYLKAAMGSDKISQVSFYDFCKLYRILCFDLNDVDSSSIYNSRGDLNVSISIKVTIEAVAFPLIIYSFVTREKEISFNFKAERLDIALNSL